MGSHALLLGMSHHPQSQKTEEVLSVSFWGEGGSWLVTGTMILAGTGQGRSRAGQGVDSVKKMGVWGHVSKS